MDCLWSLDWCWIMVLCDGVELACIQLFHLQMFYTSGISKLSIGIEAHIGIDLRERLWVQLSEGIDAGNADGQVLTMDFVIGLTFHDEDVAIPAKERDDNLDRLKWLLNLTAPLTGWSNLRNDPIISIFYRFILQTRVTCQGLVIWACSGFLFSILWPVLDLSPRICLRC